MKSKEGVNCEVIIPGTKGKCSRTIRKFMKRRNAIKPLIGHMKSDHGMGLLLAQGRGRIPY